MEQNIKAIDVEAIMADIRKTIEEKGETADILSFDELSADQECAGEIAGNVSYNETEMHRLIGLANAEHCTPFYQMIPAGGLKSFFKRSIRKMIAFIILPLRDSQIRYNSYVVQSFFQMESYILERKDVLIQQEELIEHLETKVDLLEAQCQALEERLNGKEK